MCPWREEEGRERGRVEGNQVVSLGGVTEEQEEEEKEEEGKKGEVGKGSWVEKESKRERRTERERIER